MIPSHFNLLLHCHLQLLRCNLQLLLHCQLQLLLCFLQLLLHCHLKLLLVPPRALPGELHFAVPSGWVSQAMVLLPPLRQQV